MSKQRITQVVYVTGSGATLYRCSRRGCEAVDRFAAGDEEGKRFAAAIREAPATPTHVLVDILDEEYHVGTVPHVSNLNNDRAHVLARHAEKVLRNAQFRYTVVHGRETQGRRDDRVLCVGVTNAELLQPWIKRLIDAKVALVGIHSVALLAQEAAKQLNKGEGQVLLVTKLGDHLRLSFFDDGKLKLSRLTPMRQATVSETAEAIVREVEKTQMYLGRLRLTAQNKAVVAWVVGHGMLLDLIKGKVKDNAALGWKPIDVGELATMLRLDGRWDTVDCEALFAQLAGQKAVENHYATPAHQRYARWHRANHTLRLASVLIGLTAVLAGGWNIAEGYALGAERESVERQTRLAMDRYAAVAAQLPPMPADADDVQGMVRLADKLAALRTEPQTVLEPVSRVLARFRELQLQQISWKLVTPDVVQAEFDPAAGPVDSGEMFDEDGFYHVKQVAQLQGYLDPFDGDYGRAVATLKRFADELNATGVFKAATLTKMPVELAPQALLEGATGTREELARAQFTVEVTLETRHEP